MKIVTIDCDYWVLTHVDEIRPIKELPLIDVVKAMVERYQFIVPPKEIPTKDAGLVFEEGALRKGDRTIRIKKIVLFGDGVQISVGSTSDDVDEVWKDLLELSASLGGRVNLNIDLAFHASTIVCDFEHPIDGLIKSATKLIELISSKLDIPAQVHAEGLTFLADQSRPGTQVNPSQFKIEQRMRVGFSRPRYFSLANMTTSNHVAVLEYLEQLAGK